MPINSWPRLLLRAAVGIILLGGTLGSARPASAQTVLDWAKEHSEKWYAAFNAGDAAAMVKLYAADAVLLLQGETFRGRGAIEAFHKGNFEKVRYSCTWAIDSVSIVDNLAAAWGEDTCVGTPRAGGPTAKWKGRWLTVYELQPDGTWLIGRDSGEEVRP